MTGDVSPYWVKPKKMKNVTKMFTKCGDRLNSHQFWQITQKIAILEETKSDRIVTWIVTKFCDNFITLFFTNWQSSYWNMMIIISLYPLNSEFCPKKKTFASAKHILSKASQFRALKCYEPNLSWIQFISHFFRVFLKMGLWKYMTTSQLWFDHHGEDIDVFASALRGLGDDHPKKIQEEDL